MERRREIVATLTEPVKVAEKDEPGSARKLKVLIADDHAVVREGLKTLVNMQPDMDVVGEASDGNEAPLRAGALRPDVVVMDVSMPGGGVEATAQITSRWPEIRVLALTMHEDRGYLRRLMEAGAAGYVLKRSAAEELIRAIRAVAGGRAYLDPALSPTVVETLVGRRPTLRGEFLGAALSEREAEVLRLVAQGYANKEIAARLSVSVKTVETYKARSMEKLNLGGRAEIVRYALSQGWLQDL
jgi:DNA-binding NarL/FixJ family response regulator